MTEENTPTWIEFGDLLEHSDGLGHGSVVRLLTAIKAPAELRGIVNVAGNVIDFIRILDPLAVEQDGETIEVWDAVCGAIGRQRKAIIRTFGPHCDLEGHRRVHGLYVSHPVYGCLWHRAAQAEHQDRFSVLQSLLWFWHMHVGKACRSSHPYRYAREVRILSEGEGVAVEVLPHLPDHLDSLASYRIALANLAREKKTNKQARALVARIIEMVDSAVRGVPPGSRSRNGGGIQHRGRERGDMPMIIVTAEIQLDDEDGQLQIAQLSTENLNAEYRRIGLMPGEAITKREFYSYMPGKSGVYTFAELARKIKAQRKAVSRLNAMPRPRWVDLNEHDLSVLWTFLRDDKRLAREARLLLYLCFLFGRHPEYFHNLELCLDRPSAPIRRWPLLVLAEQIMVLPLPSVLLEHRPRPSKEFVSRPVVDTLELPLCQEVVALLQRGRGDTSSPNESRVFSSPLRVLAQEIEGALRTVNGLHGCRLTVTRIASALYGEVMRAKGGDALAAAYITGNLTPFAKNAAHYLWVAADDVEKSYLRAIRRLTRSAKIVPTCANQAKIKNRKIGFGSRIVPTHEEIQGLTKSFRRVLGPRSFFHSLEAFIAYHNDYTLYTSLLFKWSTGVRSVTKPMEIPQAMDTENRIIVLSDKDRVDEYNARPVPMPDILIRHIRLYQAHLTRVAKVLHYLSPGDLIVHHSMN